MKSIKLPVLALALSLALSALVSTSAEAGVRVDQKRDGRTVITNSGSSAGRVPLRSMSTVRRAKPKTPPAEILEWIEQYSAAHRLEPELVQALIQTESAFNPNALSIKGAMGLMQLMPATATSLSVFEPWDPEQNIKGGTAYLRKMIDRFGRVDLALAAYNAGPEAVRRHGGIPPYAETRGYVTRVLSLWRGFRGGKLPMQMTMPSTPVVFRERNNRPLLTNAPGE